MSIIGIGIDIVNWSWLEQLEGVQQGNFNDAFFKHTYSSDEYSQGCACANSVQYFAGRFAVKEAFIKAGASFGDCSPETVSALRFSDIETISDENGKPITTIQGRLANKLPRDLKVHCSISHERGQSIALVILEA